MEYSKLWSIYDQAATWEEFLEEISRGRPKWLFLEALETGWRNKIRIDLLERYNAPEEEVDLLLNRYECVVSTNPMSTSAEELRQEMMRRVITVNVLRGYLRHANYTALDDPDEIIWTLDEELSKLGPGTPTREECASSYAVVTGRVKDPGAVAIPNKDADKIAVHLAARMGELHKRLTIGGAKNAEIIQEMRELDELQSALTGQSILDSEFHERFPPKDNVKQVQRRRAAR